MAREKLGAIWIDTAAVIVGEPCFLVRGPDGPARRPTWGQFVASWEEQGEDVPDDAARGANALAALRGLGVEPLPEMRKSPTDVVRLGRDGAGAIAVRTLENCDGWARVYLDRDREGRPRRLIIDLNTTTEP